MRKINPAVKALTVLCSGLILSFTYALSLNLFVIVSCLLLLAFSRVNWKTVWKIFLPATLAAASLFFAALFHTGRGAVPAVGAGSLNFGVMSANVTSVSNAVTLSMRIYAYAALGMLFALTTDSEEFIYSLMHQFRLPPKFAYGVLAAYHLLPTMKREYASIRLAYKVKGCAVSPFSLKPVFSMLVNTMHWSENVAMAMESKGFCEDGKRSFYVVTGVKWTDLAFLVGYLGSLAAVLLIA